MTTQPETADQTDLKARIDRAPMSAFQVLIVVICFVLNMNDGIDVLVVSFTGPELIREWGLSKSELGYVFSAGLAGMTAGCFLLAPFGDKVGRRTLFVMALSLITAGMLGAGFVTAYGQLLGLRFITGLGIGGILPNLAAVAAEFSNNKTRDFNVGIVQAGWPIGAILTGFFTVWAIPALGWRACYLAAGAVSALMLMSVALFMPESPGFLVERQPRNALAQLNQLLARMGQATLSVLPPASVVRSRVPVADLFLPRYKGATLRLWIGIFFAFLTLYTLMSWVPTIAKDSGMPLNMATSIGTALNLGAFAGGLVFGLATARFGLRQLITAFMGVAVGVMLLYGNLTLGYGLMFALTFFIGFFVQGGFNGFWATLARIYPVVMRTTGIGLAMGVGRFGAILGPALFGMLLDGGLAIGTLFSLFSLPLLVTGVMAFSIPARNLE